MATKKFARWKKEEKIHKGISETSGVAETFPSSSCCCVSGWYKLNKFLGKRDSSVALDSHSSGEIHSNVDFREWETWGIFTFCNYQILKSLPRHIVVSLELFVFEKTSHCTSLSCSTESDIGKATSDGDRIFFACDLRPPQTWEKTWVSSRLYANGKNYALCN